jgi:type II secretory pathway component PulK
MLFNILEMYDATVDDQRVSFRSHTESTITQVNVETNQLREKSIRISKKFDLNAVVTDDHLRQNHTLLVASVSAANAFITR